MIYRMGSIKASYRLILECLKQIFRRLKSMSEAEFRQEYEADFNTYEGRLNSSSTNVRFF